jgi:hypothetical protein
MLETEYQRFKYLKSTGSFIEPLPMRIGCCDEERILEGKTVLIPLEVYVQFIPLRDVLKQIFALPEVLKTAKSYLSLVKKSKEMLLDFPSGIHWENVTKSCANETMIPFFLY